MKTKIIYCKKCLYPNTKPNLFFNSDGICSACINFEKRNKINWEERSSKFLKFVEYSKKKNTDYHCIIPVSGGKDSTFQTLKILEHDLKPLCVTATTCSLTEIGRENIKNLQSLGVDHLELTPNPKIRSKLNKISLQTVGDISWPEHTLIFTIPIQVAIQYKIDTLIWGENGQFEYGGPESESEKNILDHKWLQEFGGLNGLRVSDFIGIDGITEKDLSSYQYPDIKLLQQKNINGLYLGYYFPWSSQKNSEISQKHGFKTWHKSVEGSYFNSENLDNYQAGIHEYFCFLKFGFARATSQVSMLIRRGEISREDGLKIVIQNEGKFPETFLGKKLDSILLDIDISIDEFVKICDRFTNKKIFETDNDGNLIKDNSLSLKKINYDN